MQTKTLNYYNTKTKEFIDGTLNVDFTAIQNRFLDKLPVPVAHSVGTQLETLPQPPYILDFGCGSGRDTKYFLDRGYQVDAIDGSEELCKFASQYTGIDVKCMYFHELEETEKYDAIWACSSILHCAHDELIDVMKRMAAALKEGGLVYTSFKYGEHEGERNGRYFIDMTEDRLAQVLETVPELAVEEQWITGDVRPGRGEEKWLNLFLRKK